MYYRVLVNYPLLSIPEKVLQKIPDSAEQFYTPRELLFTGEVYGHNWIIPNII